jgi:antitoxin (DNA-binding transcriptional repressor) of toxin-antitoxin stability system
VDVAIKREILERLLAGEQVTIVADGGEVIGVVTHEEDRHHGRWRLRVEAPRTDRVGPVAEPRDKSETIQPPA